MFSFAEVSFSLEGHTEVKINTLYNAKRERGFSVRPRAALLFCLEYDASYDIIPLNVS